ncbi:folylpolyglutamate synthase/dihydrofolate synthase family protein [Kamptonema sp. UHCC 0994]|uniref:bifunctional folylpolyglutamate synthase/dihydrofolate synthase n=1 Tax=Kamptonema sp. UHCC 0994 TaxID=3031329 RepID=UPI0023B9FA84|nr:folylpolyglutamate synthase/dihydrofolate synthase family protein [Kamptonema sp. UHCC 0994]MDF0555587.1 bifunctional folylpolyglutamate synthase/dihydrofolate synthase [Kamptonema sp. UHCC 0994]
MKIDSILKPYQHFGVNLGLDRIQQLLDKLGNPHQQLPVIHVAGTNGKGSVCAYLSSILTAAGYRVGRYTSPHLINWNERICINQKPITSEELENYLLQVVNAINKDSETPTQFEIFTAAAWLYFAQKKVDIAVVEVGLGGRLDATNVCETPLVSIITSISREHWQVLGPTLADIAGEKAGILKQNCPAVIGQLPPEAKAVIEKRILQLNCPTIWPKPALDLGKNWAEYHPEPDTQMNLPTSAVTIKYPLPLLGEIQLMNSALAIAACQILQQKRWEISETAIQNGMANTQWSGRLQWTNWRNHKLLIDGAHNPAAAIALRQYVQTLDCLYPQQKGKSWVMGMLSTKDHADIFKALLQTGDRLYLVPVPDHSSAEPEELAKLALTICPELSHCQTYPDLVAGLEAAIISESLTILCGSLYLVGYFFQQQEQD